MTEEKLIINNPSILFLSLNTDTEATIHIKENNQIYVDIGHIKDSDLLSTKRYTDSIFKHILTLMQREKFIGIDIDNNIIDPNGKIAKENPNSYIYIMSKITNLSLIIGR